MNKMTNYRHTVSISLNQDWIRPLQSESINHQKLLINYTNEAITVAYSNESYYSTLFGAAAVDWKTRRLDENQIISHPAPSSRLLGTKELKPFYILTKYKRYRYIYKKFNKMIVFDMDIHFDGWWYWTYATLKVLPVSN